MAREEIGQPCMCGGEVGIWRGNSIAGPYHYAECFECGRKTQKFPSHTRAVYAWRSGAFGPPKTQSEGVGA